MKRTIVKIDEDTCNGCGNCVDGCHEGALQLINGKAVVISEMYCDGLGACIGECPVGAITLEETEALPYDEIAVMERLIVKGEAVIVAHLNHLKESGEEELLAQGLGYLKEKGVNISLNVQKQPSKQFSGCPGSMMREVNVESAPSVLKMPSTAHGTQPSELRQFPVQLHLINPNSGIFKGSNLLLASDCSAFASGDFHSRFLKGKTLAIACPKLDSNTEIYVEKLRTLIEDAQIDTITVLMMEVPCCGGLLRMAQKARENANRFIPIKSIYLSVSGNLINEQWG